jgi:murein DD-endopeptidase MepM/ murein hydrolase activator NlpD
MKTAGVAPSWTPDTVGWYVRLYGNYQPFGHAGTDIKCPEGTPVYSMAAGTVLWADWGTKLPGDESNWGYRQRWYLYKGFPGIVTVIQHAGWIGVYAHLSEARMNTGDKVRDGQQIGLSGGTGGVAPHLHVEALIDTSYKTGGGLIYGRTNPEPYFGSAAIAPQGTTTTKRMFQHMTPQEEAEVLKAARAVNRYLNAPTGDIPAKVVKAFMAEPITRKGGTRSGTTTPRSIFEYSDSNLDEVKVKP